MPALLLPMPFLTALDNQGRPIANARLYLYESGGTTNATAYTTKDLVTPHDQPIVADAAGRFPAIYLQDTNPPYRAVLQDANGALIANTDPINGGPGTIDTNDIADLAVNNAKLAVGAAAANLGFTPLNKAGDTATDLDLVHATPIASSAGYMGAPPNLRNEAYTLGITDAGKTILHTDNSTAHAYTIPLAAAVPFADETYIAIRNVGASAVTITRTGGVELRGEGTGDDKNWILAQHGKAVISKHTGNIWYIAGSGLS